MFKKIFAFFGMFLLLGGKPLHAASIINEQDFTKEYVSYLAATRPELVIEVVRPLEMRAKTAQHDFGTLYLTNLYGLYQQQPERKDEFFSKYAASLLDHVQEPPVALETLVAVVKAKDWVDDMNRATMGTEGGGFQILSEPITDNLSMVYATDTPHSVTYQNREKILALDPSREKIREESIRNLRKSAGDYSFEPIERGVYELRSSVGDYDSSIPLLPEAFDKFPDQQNGGEIVFSIPSRNVLVATRSLNKEGISFLRDLTQRIYSTDPYFISASLFTIKNGVWNVYKE